MVLINFEKFELKVSKKKLLLYIFDNFDLSNIFYWHIIYIIYKINFLMTINSSAFKTTRFLNYTGI